MRVGFRSLLVSGLALLAVSTAAAADRAIIVLDGSGSMWGQIDGKPKLEIARETLRTVLGTVPADLELGLMAYGHRQKGVCTDIELVVEPAAGTGASIADAADKMRFLGMTPLSEAVKQAAESLRYTEEKATVILITDGIETCNADPCALANELEQSGVDFTAHVVGFGLSDEEGRQVACLAENTGGKFIQAGDAASLGNALTQTVAVIEPEPEPEPEPQPEPVAEFNFMPTMALSEDTDDLGRNSHHRWEVHRALPDGSQGEWLRTEYMEWKGNLDPGSYIVSAIFGSASTSQPITIEAGVVYDPHFILNAGIVVIRPYGAAGEPVHGSAAVRFDYPGGTTTEYGQARVILPAGDITATVTIGKGEASETFALQAGRTVEKDIVVGVGRAVAKVFYVPGMAVENRSVVTEIYKARKSIDGSREHMQTEYQPVSEFDLPAGEYMALSRVDAAVAETAFTVAAGERVELDVVVNAGVLAVTAPGAARIEIYDARRDIQGNRNRIETAYEAEMQHTVAAGDYVAVAIYDGDRQSVEKQVTVPAGERAEITVP